MTFPVLHLSGTAYEQGFAHGDALRDRIGENLDVYFDRFLTEGKLEADEARARAATYQPLLESHAYWHGIKGVAEGSGFPLADILALNMRYELLYYQYGVCAQVQGCTSFALQPRLTENGHLLIGQNWDWIPQVRGAVVHTTESDGLETLSFTEAGIVGGKIGLNSFGLSLAINGLLTTVDDWARGTLPFHVRCYEILRSRSLADAARVVTGTPRPCSANFLLAQTPDLVMNLEAAPSAVRTTRADEGYEVHTNHFLRPDALGVREPEVERRPHSLARQSRMCTLIDARRPMSLGDLQESLRDHDDHPDGVCRHENLDDPPEERYITVTSVIMDLDERSLHLTDGPPCEHVYDGYSLPHTALIGE
jgi:isopenicillin-N N-acyltransferase-like protein